MPQALRLRSKQRVSQPAAGVGIDWSNPLTRGLVFAYSGVYDQDIVTGTVATNSGVSSRRVNKNGVGPYISGTSYLDFANNNAWNTTGAFSLVWGGVLDATTGAYRCPISKASGNAATNTPFDVYVDTTSGKFVLVRSNATLNRSYTLNTTLPSAGAFSTLAIASTGALIESTHIALVNGVEQTSITQGGSGFGAATANTKGIRIGRRDDGVTQLTGQNTFAFLFSRNLRVSELAALSNNPWQIFQAPTRRIWVPSGSTGFSTNLSWMTA